MTQTVSNAQSPAPGRRLKRTTATNASTADLVAIVRDVLACFGEGQTASVKPLILIMHALSTYIQTVRAEIATLQSDDLKGQCIPQATDELEAIVTTTAEATNAIMDAAERLQALGGEVSEAGQAVVMAETMRIFEACAFQDITGQRISKVIHAFRHIEQRIDEFMAMFADGSQQGADGGAEAPAWPSPAPLPAAADETSLCNGPQLPQLAKSQAEIDALFDSL
jgi:chemotaxis protein CheZ